MSEISIDESAKLHPFSIAYRAVSQLGQVGFVVFLSFYGGTDAVDGFSVVILALAAAVVALAAVLAWQFAYYRRFEYEVTDDSFDIRSGVISRRNRQIPLRRVQNVDITENVVHRFLGIARVNVETAGGNQSEASLRYVGADRAREIQREVRRRKTRLAGDDGDGVAHEQGGGERGEALYEISNHELLLVSSFSIDARLVAFAFFAVSFLPPESLPFDTLFDALPSRFAVLPIVVLAFVVVFVLWLIGFATSFSRYYGFVLRRIEDTLGYERGLFNRYSGSVPVDKIQTFTLEENVLKRYFGYATLGIETAGYSPTQTRQQGSETAVPLAKRGRVLELAHEIDGVEDPEFTLPPKRARRRYAIRYTLLLGFLSAVLYAASVYVTRFRWYLPLAALPLVPVAAHLKWRNRGYYLGEDYAATRNGFWNRTTVVLPYYRVQNVIESATILQRRWRIATVTLDTAGSSGLRNDEARAVDIDAYEAERMTNEVRDRLQESLAERRAERRRDDETWLDTVARESPDARDDAQDT
ncbi:MAG: PH domain-containing protein [Halobacteriales archaeon]